MGQDALARSVPGEQLTKKNQFDLTRLIFSVVGIFAGCRLFSWAAGWYLAQSLGSSPNTFAGKIVSLAYPANSVFIFAEMLVVIWIYRPVKDILDLPQEKSVNLWTRDVPIGIGAGIFAFLVAIPFLGDLNTRTFFFIIFPDIHVLTLHSVLYAFLLGVALPFAGEMVFRGIVLRTLQTHAGATAAILASTLLFVSLWPLFNVVVSLILGITASLLYVWRKSLLSPILADIVVTICGAFYVFWRNH
jgi:membrane protease YdiL (CAAX protease family)